jgi:hypothetical protein
MLNPNSGHSDMKKYNPVLPFVLLLLLAWPIITLSQVNIKDETTERVALFADRSLFIAGEELRFYAKVIGSDNSGPETKSQILYCELISPDGIKISGSKYLIKQSTAEGCIAIPKEQVSGMYYLRAYTKVMRNLGPGAYDYIQIKIVNPDRNEILVVENSVKSTLLKMVKDSIAGPKNMLSVDVNKQLFSPNETVTISLKSSDNHTLEIKDLCLSIVPERTESIPLVSQQTKLQRQKGELYFTEDKGLSLTGKLTASGGVPLQGKVISLSIIGEGRDFMAARTDTSGRFFFALPDYAGKRDLFLSAEKSNLPDVKIWVDNDFCAIPVHLGSPVFSLSDAERKVAENMALNQQIDSHFNTDTVTETIPSGITDRPFYGEPTSILTLDQFVQLPTLEEYFNELPGQVKVRKRSGEKYFKVIGAYDLSFYDPLVLVDWVAVDELSRILAIAPRNISRIEIVNQLYVKGGQTYGGIISIISKKGDFAGIDLPSTGIFINFRFLTQNLCRPIPEMVPADSPDIRNTILWKPGISLKDNGTSSFSFSAPYTPGKYSIILEGLSPEGTRFSVKRIFGVEN